MPAMSMVSTDADIWKTPSPLMPWGTRCFSCSNVIGLWRVTDDGDVTSGGIPNLSARLVKLKPTLFRSTRLLLLPDSFLNTNDDRMGQLEFIDGELWSSVETSVNIKGTRIGEVVGAAWFNIDAATGGVERQGYVATKGQYLIYRRSCTHHGLDHRKLYNHQPDARIPVRLFSDLSFPRLSESEAQGVSSPMTFRSPTAGETTPRRRY